MLYFGLFASFSIQISNLHSFMDYTCVLVYLIASRMFIFVWVLADYLILLLFLDSLGTHSCKHTWAFWHLSSIFLFKIIAFIFDFLFLSLQSS